VELVGELCMQYDRKAGYTRKNKIDVVWENSRKGLNESSKILYC
jgi:hypothetical protein